MAVARALFTAAIPTVAVELGMDRAAALAEAAALADRYGWGAPDDRSAASFGVTDSEVQTYVELAGGGRAELERLAERGLYAPYQWRVRRFAEGRIEEVEVRFTPAGEAYGFALELEDADAAGGNLDGASARALAEATAADWGIDLEEYRLLESSIATLPGGREDHTFVLERSDERLADARFRLRIRVAGSRVSELTRFVFVPEAFSRRYADTRAANFAIANVATAVYVLLFILLGAGVGSALLLRRGWLEWRAPLRWGIAIAVLFGLNTVNQLPLAWMAYDTALSAEGFVLQEVGAAGVLALLGTLFVGFVLMAGESLGRRAFPGHVRQWKFWAREVAASNTALGMTYAAYLLVGIQLGYVVLFYLGTQRLEGWWSPAEALVQPDLLATYVPWLQAVSLALLAAFWEESAFRAVPIACAALLGERFGGKRIWIWSAVVLQAVVFAAAHANYPQQPAYARVVELTLPALVWGVVYVRVGLVPTILAHFLYDLSLISLVLFGSAATLDQAVIVAVGVVPLVVVLAARSGGRGAPYPPAWAYNGAWMPARDGAGEAVEALPPAPEIAAPSPRAAVPSGEVALDAATPPVEAPGPREGAAAPRAAQPAPAAALRPLLAALVGLALWAGAVATREPPPRLWGTREEAVEIAREALAAAGAPVAEWSTSVRVIGGADRAREYVWREAGPDAFAALEGTWFGEPRWEVRLVDWDAPPEQRGEEYRVWVGDGGAIDRLVHVLPESAPGPRLDVDAARALALDALRERFGLEASALRLVESDETSRPDRSDWTFSFAVAGLLESVEGEARVRVSIAGDEVVDAVRSVRVPQAWERERARLETRLAILRGGLGALLVVGFGAAAVVGVVAWSRGRLPGRPFRLLSVTSLALGALVVWNQWPTVTAAFTTEQPRGVQVAGALIGLAIVGALTVPAVGLVGALAQAWLAGAPRTASPLAAGAALGASVGGLLAVAGALVPSAPAAGVHAGAGARMPVLATATGDVLGYLAVTAGVLLLCAARRRLGGHAAAQGAGWGMLLAASIVAVPAPLQGTPLTWGAVAVGVAALLWVVFRVLAAAPARVPGAVAALLALLLLELAWAAPYEGARGGALLGTLLLGGLAFLWTRELEGPDGPAPQSPRSLASVGSE